MYMITIIEDDELLAKYLFHEFSDAGFTVRIARDGVSGINEVRANPPALLLLDIILPGKGGIEILEELRTDPRTQAIPVLVMSVSGTDDVIKHALRLGAVDYVVKSQHTTGEIVDKAKQYLSRSTSPEIYAHTP